MRFVVSVSFFLFILLFSCAKSNKEVSFSSIHYDCPNIDFGNSVSGSHFDSLKQFIHTKKPDLISFKENQYTDICKENIELEGYQFIPISIMNDSAIVYYSTVAIRNSSFEFLSSSNYIFKTNELEAFKNMLSWYQLKNASTGHIFYFFRLQLQDSLDKYEEETLALDVLKRIDETSAGLPVILMANFKASNAGIRELLSKKWSDMYALKHVKIANRNTDFLVNDFFKNVSSLDKNDKSHPNQRVVLRFNFNSNNISKCHNGENLPR